MEIAPQIFKAKIIHKRLLPKVNTFTYRLYYLAIPLPATSIPSWVQSFPKEDLGYRDGYCPEIWARSILKSYNLSEKTAHIMLITMPRVLGYVFNPVSFYLCFDSEKHLRAVISEVHNTFGEQHSYLCAHPDHKPIDRQEWMEAEKLFHVSPFLERNGRYHFRFDIQPEKIGISIDYYDKENNKQFFALLAGDLSPLNRSSLSRVFWEHPLVTLKAICLIHWQALKLLAKGIRYIPKPRPYTKKLTVSDKLENCKQEERHT